LTSSVRTASAHFRTVRRPGPSGARMYLSGMTSLPIDLVLVRHGQSEANVVQKREKAIEEAMTTGGTIEPLPQAGRIFERHDSEHRLTRAGRDQAVQAGEWLAEHGLKPRHFSGRFVSPYNRTLETAVNLDSRATWMPDARLVERDWGEYGSTPAPDRTHRFPDTERMRQASAFFARMAGGESIFDTSFRVREFLGMCAREYSGERVIAVTHGEVMWATRFVLERLMPHEWQELDEQKDQKIANCTVLHYTRENPDGSGDLADSLSSGWRRIVDPIDGNSPNGGDWERLPGKRFLNAAELRAIFSNSKPLLRGFTE
jgi:broad specificity phosphatase PhoE